MALLFDDSLVQYADLASAISVSFPFTIGCFAFIDDLAPSQAMVAINNNASEDNYHALIVAAGNVRCRTRGASNADADSTLGLSVNTWHACMGIWNASASRAAYLDGANEGLNLVGDQTPTGLNRTSIARSSKLTPDLFTSGRLAKVAIWDVALTQKEREEYAIGLDPRMIRPQSLVFYSEIFDAAIVDIMGKTSWTLNNGPVLADNPPLVLGGQHRVSSQAAPAGGPLQPSITNVVGFGQTVSVQAFFNRSLQSDMLLQQNAFDFALRVAVSNEFGFSNVAEPKGSVFNRSLIDQFLFEDTQAKLVIEDTAGNTIAFLNEAARAAKPTSDLSLGQSLIAEATKTAKNSIGFGQTVSVVIIPRNLNANNALGFGQSVVTSLLRVCDLPEYTPSGSFPANPLTSDNPSLTLVGVGSLTLRNPEFGDKESLQIDRALNVSRAGRRNIFRQSTWPKTIRLTYTFRELTTVEATAILTFIQANLGLPVTLTTHDGRVLTVFLQPEESQVTDTRAGDCRWGAALSMIGAAP